MAEMLYNSLEELKDAFDSGELNPHTNWLTIDNDRTSVYVPGEGGERSVKVFEGGCPEDLLEQALDLLGVPHMGA